MADLLRLVPEKKGEGFNPKRLVSENASLVFFAFVFLMLGIVWGGLTIYKTNLGVEIDELSKAASTVRAEIIQGGEVTRKYQDLLVRLSILSNLLEKHVEFRPMLEAVEAVTHPLVEFRSFTSAGGSREISLSGRAASYSILAKQLKAFEEDPRLEFKNLGGLSIAGDGGVGFSVTLLAGETLLLTQW